MKKLHNSEEHASTNKSKGSANVSKGSVNKSRGSQSRSPFVGSKGSLSDGEASFGVYSQQSRSEIRKQKRI